LHEDYELTIARFIKGLSPTIPKVELQPYLSFDDVCLLAIEIEKQLKGRKLFQLHPFVTPKAPPRASPHKVDTSHTPIKTFDKGKGTAGE